MKQKNGKYPEKTRINLVIREKNQFHLSRLVPGMLALILLVAAFARFAVMLPLQKVSAAQAALDERQAYYRQLVEANAGFEDVAQTYSRYSTDYMTPEEAQLVPRTEVLELVRTVLMEHAGVQQLSLEGNVLSVELAGLTLGEISSLVQTLTQLPLVQDVEVYTATTGRQSGEEAAASMEITLQNIAEGGQAS